MYIDSFILFFFFFQAEDGIRDLIVTGVQTCALPIFDVSGPGVAAPGAPEAGPGGRGRDDHAARVRCSSVAGLHPGAVGPPPLGGNGSLRPLPPGPVSGAPGESTP